MGIEGFDGAKWWILRECMVDVEGMEEVDGINTIIDN